jgi:hypothetical protein
LLERFVVLTKKAEATAEIRSHIRIVGAFRNRFLIVLDRMSPILTILIPVG